MKTPALNALVKLAAEAVAPEPSFLDQMKAKAEKSKQLAGNAAARAKTLAERPSALSQTVKSVAEPISRAATIAGGTIAGTAKDMANNAVATGKGLADVAGIAATDTVNAAKAIGNKLTGPADDTVQAQHEARLQQALAASKEREYATALKAEQDRANTPEDVSIAGLGDTADAARPGAKTGPVATNDAPTKFGIPTDKMGVDPTKLPAYAAMANKAQASAAVPEVANAKAIAANKASRAAQTTEAAKPMNRLADWARGDSFIPGVNKGVATGLGVGAAGLLAYLLTRDDEKKTKKVAANLTYKTPSLGGRALGDGLALSPVKAVKPSLAQKTGGAVTKGLKATLGAAGKAMPVALPIAGAGGAYVLGNHVGERDGATAAKTEMAGTPGGVLNNGIAAVKDTAVKAQDHLGNAYNSVKSWAGEDTGFGVNKGTAAGIGLGAAGLLAYLLRRDKNDD